MTYITCKIRESLKRCNKRNFVWNEPHETAFQKILDLVADITDLFHYDPAKRTRVKCDTSHSGLGACLEQEADEGLRVPISFASRFLNSTELKYSTNELELLAVVWACEHFRTYLLGNKFEILTDHKAIISAPKEHRGNKPYQSRLTRWADRLLPFDYDIRHVPGATLGMVDYLSRHPTFDAPLVLFTMSYLLSKPSKILLKRVIQIGLAPGRLGAAFRSHQSHFCFSYIY